MRRLAAIVAVAALTGSTRAPDRDRMDSDSHERS